MTKKQTHLHDGWPEGEYIHFQFLVNYTFNMAPFAPGGRNGNYTIKHLSNQKTPATIKLDMLKIEALLFVCFS